MSKQSVVVLDDTGIVMNVTGDKIKADAWFGFTDGLHTVTFHLENFTGRIFLEASLESDPQEIDWFSIFLNGANAFIEYPLDPLTPTGVAGDTFVDAFTFQGNFLYIRVRIDRSYITPVPTTDVEKSLLGSVKKILLNH